MQFNSYLFILAFLPSCILLYFLVNRICSDAGKAILVLAGCVFYFYAGKESALIFCISIGVNLAAAFFMQRYKKRKLILVCMIIANVGMLLVYKYSFFASQIAKSMGVNVIEVKDLIQPLGISFFTFQQIMFLIAVYRQEISKISILDYLAYILYFPKLIMGPLIEPRDFMKQINDSSRKRFNLNNLATGIKIFSFGLGKKMLLADTFMKAVNWGFEHLETASSGDLFLVMLFYTFEIYFDFSGYSDMAIGVSRMLNIDLPMNFNSPYKALSIQDFWKRWHMSLTGFFTHHVYFPLGGSRKGKGRTYVNILIVFLLSGIWHGANWTFILWGVIYGVLQIIERILFSKEDQQKNYAAKWIFTFLMINVLWLLFRAESIQQWGYMLKKMLSFQSMKISSGLLKCFILPENAFLIDMFRLTRFNNAIRGFSSLVFTATALIICLVPKNNYETRDKLSVWNMVFSALIFVWSFLCLSSESTFVYFNF